MQKDMETSPQQTSLFTEEELTSSPVASHVSPTQQQGKDSVKRMSATCGLTCLGQLEKLRQDGSWAKMFSALLIGQTDWYSRKCKLTWKLKGTKYSRMYFQLVPSTLPIEETGFGLLPTPNAMDTMKTKSLRKDNNLMNGGRHGVSLHHLASHNLLPNPLPSLEDGTHSHLNPRFVLEMMGFPPDWTELPFRSGETKASRQQETQ